MPRLPRYLAAELQRREDERKIARILLEVGDEAPPVVSAAGATSGGDVERLRGLPAIGSGVSGSTVETDPVRALLAKERRRRRPRG